MGVLGFEPPFESVVRWRKNWPRKRLNREEQESQQRLPTEEKEEKEAGGALDQGGWISLGDGGTSS